MSVSTDGSVLWWDIRKLGEPTETLTLKERGSETVLGAMRWVAVWLLIERISFHKMLYDVMPQTVQVFIFPSIDTACHLDFLTLMYADCHNWVRMCSLMLSRSGCSWI